MFNVFGTNQESQVLVVDGVELQGDMFMDSLNEIFIPVFDTCSLKGYELYREELQGSFKGKVCVVNGTGSGVVNIKNIEADALVVLNCERVIFEELYVGALFLLSSASVMLQNGFVDKLFCLNCAEVNKGNVCVGILGGFCKIFRSEGGSVKKMVLAADEISCENTSIGRKILYTPGVLNLDKYTLKIENFEFVMDMKLLQHLNDFLLLYDDSSEDSDAYDLKCSFASMFFRNYFMHTPFPIDWMCDPSRIPGFNMKMFQRRF